TAPPGPASRLGSGGGAGAPAGAAGTLRPAPWPPPSSTPPLPPGEAHRLRDACGAATARQECVRLIAVEQPNGRWQASKRQDSEPPTRSGYGRCHKTPARGVLLLGHFPREKLMLRISLAAAL